MAVGPCAFVQFETFNGSVYLLVGDVFEGSAGMWVVIVRFDVVILRGGTPRCTL
jgi:hypothetical protein